MNYHNFNLEIFIFKQNYRLKCLFLLVVSIDFSPKLVFLSFNWFGESVLIDAFILTVFVFLLSFAIGSYIFRTHNSNYKN